MAKLNCVFLVGLIAVVIGVVSAITDEEKANVRALALPILKACGDENGVSQEDRVAAREAKNPDALNSCFYACVMKKTGVMNDQGLFDVAAAQENHKKFIHGEDDLKNLNDISSACASVNDQAVSDGAKGCDRAKLLVHCMLDHQDSFGAFFE